MDSDYEFKVIEIALFIVKMAHIIDTESAQVQRYSILLNTGSIVSPSPVLTPCRRSQPSIPRPLVFCSIVDGVGGWIS